MGILKEFQELINDYSHDSTLRPRLVFLGNKVAKLVKEHTALKKEFADVSNQLANSDARQSKKVSKGELLEYQGVLFMRKPDGSFQDSPYCPTCKNPMEKFDGFIKYNCLQCGITTAFTDKDLPDILKELK